MVICKARKSQQYLGRPNTESEAPTVARWAALVGYAKRTVLRVEMALKGIGGGGESCIKRQIGDRFFFLHFHVLYFHVLHSQRPGKNRNDSDTNSTLLADVGSSSSARPVVITLLSLRSAP